MTEDEAITVTLALHAGGDQVVVRRQVERLDRLLPDIAWSEHMAALNPSMCAPATTDEVMRGRELLRDLATEYGVGRLRWSPSLQRMIGHIDVDAGQHLAIWSFEEAVARLLHRTVELVADDWGTAALYERDAVEL